MADPAPFVRLLAIVYLAALAAALTAALTIRETL
jgi:hypothetical protein